MQDRTGYHNFAATTLAAMITAFTTTKAHGAMALIGLTQATWVLSAWALLGVVFLVVVTMVWVITLRRKLASSTFELREERARLRAITESVPGIVYGFFEREDGKRELRYSNGRAEQWRREFTALTPDSLIHPEWMMNERDAADFLRRMGVDGRPRRVQHQIHLVGDKGNDRWIQITLDPEPVKNGVLWHGIMQDATELRIAADALARSEKNFREIFQSTRDAILVFAPGGGMILEANAAACELYGYPREQLLTMEASQILEACCDFEMAADCYSETCQRHRLADGTQRDMECHMSLIEFAGDHAILCIGRDVSFRVREEEQRALLENRLEHARKMESLGLLAGGIAHDFNNLLVGIMGNASLARAPGVDRNALDQSLDQIIKTTARASELTQQLLAYAGKAKLKVTALDLSDTVTEMVRMLGNRLSPGAKLTFSIFDRPVLTLADPVQIRQIVMNLLTNASDALRGGVGVITVRTSVAYFDRFTLSETFVASDISEGYYAVLEVADDGCGIPADTLPKIFDPYYSTKFIGRGLGLSSTLSIIQRHRGAIKVMSEDGKGTIFRLLLPLAPGFAQERSVLKDAGSVQV